MKGEPAASGLWFLNGHVTIKLSKRNNADSISIIEHHLPAGFGPPLHIHRYEDEMFYVLDGEIRFRMGDSIREARTGEIIHLPAGVPHGFKVLSATGGRALTVTRGGFEDMVASASRPASAVMLPPYGEPTPEMQQRLFDLCAQNGIDLVGPPID